MRQSVLYLPILRGSRMKEAKAGVSFTVVHII